MMQVEIYFPKHAREEERRLGNSHIQICICSHHVKELEHSRDKQYQKIRQLALIFHKSRVGESYYPSHLRPLLEAKKLKVSACLRK